MRRLVLTALTLALVTLPTAAGADDAKKKADLDPKVLELVKQAAALHKSARSVHVEGSVVTDVVDDRGKRQVKTEVVYDLERPNHFALKTRLDGDAAAGVDVVCDGKKLIVQAKRLKQYTEEAPADNLAAIGQMLPRYPNQTGMLFQNVLSEDPYETLMDGVTSCSYAGKEKVNGAEAHHLKFEQKGLDWELWVAAEGQPVVLKAASTQEGGDVKATSVETYRNWKFDAAPPKDAFTFTPVAESKKVKVIRPEN
jgi:hypothetical protein